MRFLTRRSSAPGLRVGGPLVAVLLALSLAAYALPQESAGKRPLHHGDYDGWRSIQTPVVSRDGRFLAYILSPQVGDGEVVVRNLATGVEWRHARGGKGEAGASPKAGAGKKGKKGLPQTGLPQTGQLAFTADGRFLLFTFRPARPKTDQSQPPKKTAVDALATTLGIMDLANGKVTTVPRVSRFQVAEQDGRFAVYLLAPPGGGAPAKAGAAGSDKKKKDRAGSDLVIHTLANHATRVVPEVAEFTLTKDGQCLVYTVASKTAERNGLYALRPDAAGAPAPLLTGRGRYAKLTWDERQTRLAFLSDRDEAEASQPRFTLYCWERKAAPQVGSAAVQHACLLLTGWPVAACGVALAQPPGAAELPGRPPAALVSTKTPHFHPGMVISDKGALSLTPDGGRIFFGVAPPEPPEEKDAALGERVVVDLWHWKDDFIQPMQKIRAPQERARTFRAVYHLAERKFTQLADATLPQALPSRDGRWALGVNDRPYRILVGYDTTYSDYHLLDTLDGSRKELRKKQQGALSWSPGGKYALFFDGTHWNSIAVPSGKVANLTGQVKARFYLEDFDSPSTPPPHGVAGWAQDDRFVLLYDRYDVWQVSPDGSSATNLTHGLGREKKVQFRIIRLGGPERALDLRQPLLLRAEDLQTRDTGFYRVQPGGRPEMLLMAAKNFGPPLKAKNADVVVLPVSTFHEFPDLYATDGSFREMKRVTRANPQQDGLLWGRAELVRFKNLDGVALSGVLIKPENFDPGKKYPMLVYIYEKLSQNLHHFVDPKPGTSINPSYYASNGYLVFMPDIVYTIGSPGQSALKCVLPGIQAMVDQGFVDENAIGIQGHSWGGYQIAYLITQTGRFKAAAAGAPVANMTSAYGGIRWGSGLPRQFQYERTQSRIGGSLWQYPTRFVENSPLFMADRVKTPLLMLHNDQDDAVPWQQGIEYFLALRRLGKEVYLFNYNGELHGLRKRANQKDYTVRLQQFFDHHLRGVPQPAWMEHGIPYRPRPADRKGKGPAAAEIESP